MPSKILKTEEDVKVKILLPLLREKGYDLDLCDFEKSINVQQGRQSRNIFADVVIYGDKRMQRPLIAVDTKPPKEPISDRDRGQAISYARLLDTIAPLAVVTNGHSVEAYDTYSRRRLVDLPDKRALVQHLKLNPRSHDDAASLREEARHTLLSIDSVQAFKRILKSCHNEIRNNKGFDPTIAFDELSKIMFCKLYEETSEHPTRFRTTVFDESLRRPGHTVIHQIFDEMVTDPRYSALFCGDTMINLDDRTIRKIVELLQDYDLSRTDFDVKGEAFEFFLGDTFTGGLGQYFTPRNVVKFIVDAMEPTIGEPIIDPFCGTGGFLIFAFREVERKISMRPLPAEKQAELRKKLAQEHLVGTDWAERTSRACKMNMVVHGDGRTKIFKHHGLVDIPGEVEEGQFRMCLTNPPFGSIENDPEVLHNYELGDGRRSQERLVLAIERAIRLVEPGGRIGIVVMTGILNNGSTGYVREYIKKHAWIQAVISLPAETFEGYGGRSDTSILFLERKKAPDDGKQEDVFMAVCQNAGYAPNGDSIPGNELPSILDDYHAFSRGEPFGKHPHTWSVPELADRLDPHYYWPRSSDVDRQAVEASAKEVAAQMAALASESAFLGERIAETFVELQTRPMKVGELVHEVVDKHALESDNPYQLLGVRWWGGGAFVREEKLGEEIKARTLGKVQPGWLIYNRLFAFRGSFALVTEECGDGYVSSEFPTFVANAGVADPDLVLRYLVHALNSPQYLLIVDSRSTGSTRTSRNRFMQADFLEMAIAMPTDHTALLAVVELLDTVARLHRQQGELHESCRELTQGVARLLRRV